MFGGVEEHIMPVHFDDGSQTLSAVAIVHRGISQRMLRPFYHSWERKSYTAVEFWLGGLWYRARVDFLAW